MPPKQINPHYSYKNPPSRHGGNTCLATLEQAHPRSDNWLSYTFVWFNDPNLTKMFGLVVRTCVGGRLQKSSVVSLTDARARWEGLIAIGYTRENK